MPVLLGKPHTKFEFFPIDGHRLYSTAGVCRVCRRNDVQRRLDIGASAFAASLPRTPGTRIYNAVPTQLPHSLPDTVAVNRVRQVICPCCRVPVPDAKKLPNARFAYDAKQFFEADDPGFVAAQTREPSVVAPAAISAGRSRCAVA